MEGKVAIVTGAASGIGKAYSEILLENKAKVCLVDVNTELGKNTEEEFKQKFGEKQVLFIQCDITLNEQLEAVFTKTFSSYGRLDIVINNAGISDEANPQRVIAINLTAVLQGCYLGIKYMGTDKGGKGGVIINTASIYGLYSDDSIPSCYGATKHGVVGFTRSMGAISIHKHGVRINAVCPAMVDTPLLNTVVQERIAELLKKYSRILSPREVAQGMWKLLEDESLSGQCMIVGPEGGHLASKMPASYQEALAMYTDYTA